MVECRYPICNCWISRTWFVEAPQQFLMRNLCGASFFVPTDDESLQALDWKMSN
jgi:hypothetical protein